MKPKPQGVEGPVGGNRCVPEGGVRPLEDLEGVAATRLWGPR